MNTRIADILQDTYAFQDEVLFCCMPDDPALTEFPGIPATILNVHFYPGQKEAWVKYDIVLQFVGGMSSRVYNVDTILLAPRGKTLERIRAGVNAIKPMRVVGMSREVLNALRQTNPYQAHGEGSYHSMYNEVVDTIEKTLNGEAWAYVHDNCDGFRDFLALQNISYKGAGHGTLVPAGTDLYKLGIDFQQYKADRIAKGN